MSAKLSEGDLNLTDDATVELWHRRLGHMSEKGSSNACEETIPT